MPAAQLRTVATLLVVALVIACSPGASPAGGGPGKRTPAPYRPGVRDATLLPAASPMPAGPPDKQAEALAKQASGGGDSAVAAWLTALPAAGIGVVDLDGSVVAKPQEPALGINILAGEVPLLATLAHRGQSSSLNAAVQDWADITGTRPDPASARKALVKDYNALSRQSTVATARFYAYFLSDLGGGLTAPNSLLVEGDPSDASLSGAQIALMFFQWARDARVAAAGHRAHLAEAGLRDLVLAAAHQPFANAGGLPCTMGSTEGQISDAAATGTGILAGHLWDFLGSAKAGAPAGVGPVPDEKLFGKLALVGVALTLAKMFLQAALFDGKMELENGEPLTRTRETGKDAESRVIKLNVRFHVGNGQLANCFRYVLNLAGTDFSLPNDGGIGGAHVNWIMFDDPGGILQDPTQFYTVQDTATTTITDNDGNTRTGLQGKRQRVKLPDGVPSVIRRVKILAGIAIKADTIFNDLNDAIGAATAGPAAPVSIISSILDRSSTYDVTHTFEVKDWAKDFKVDADARYYSPGDDSYPHVAVIKCNGLKGTWNLKANGGEVSVVLDENGTGEVPSDLGGPVKVTVNFKGDGAPNLHMENDAIIQEWPLIPGDFCDGDTPRR